MFEDLTGGIQQQAVNENGRSVLTEWVAAGEFSGRAGEVRPESSVGDARQERLTEAFLYLAEVQQHERRCRHRLALAVPPGPHEVCHPRAAAFIASRLDLLEQHPGGTPLLLRSPRIDRQRLHQYLVNRREPHRSRSPPEATHRWLTPDRAGSAEIIIRINGIDAKSHDDDLRYVSELPSSVAIMCPKSEPRTLRDVARRIDGRHELYALVETVAGVLGLRDMATVKGLQRFAFGNIDFGVDSGITVSDEEIALAAVRTMFVLESRLGGLPAPVDGVSLELRDQARISEHAARAKRFGFGGKLCIHPAQVLPVNETFAPSAAEIEWARNVLARFDSSGGSAIAYEGETIDRPVAERASRILKSVSSTR